VTCLLIAFIENIENQNVNKPIQFSIKRVVSLSPVVRISFALFVLACV